MPAQFNNMLMTGGTLNIAEGDIHINNSGKESKLIERGINDLFLNVAPGAFHDSGECFDPPKCHPNTRVAVIQEILDWLDDPQSPQLVMWLHGAAGAGKSAIAQKMAQMLFEQGRLSGAFFFARASTTGRSDQRRLVPTLAYQLAKFLPDTRFHIASTVVSDPTIFSLALHTQVQDLLIHPLWLASNALSSSHNTSPRVFIIDGLDECRNPDVQCLILRVFAAAVKSMPNQLPHKLLIASRSEIHLLAGFNEHDTAAMCRRLPLGESYNPDADIRLFLQDTFSKIKGEHHMRTSLDNAWPSEENISSLVQKSSGQFIYASTVVKYITSARHHPAERLKVILGLKPAGRNDRPFAELDSLYTHIFNNVEDIGLVLCILRLALAGSFVTIPLLECNGTVYRHLLGMTVEELELALGDLVSVISFDRGQGWFKFLHASIPDFLLDENRSRSFYVDQPTVNLYRAECCVKVICILYSNRPCAARYSAAWFHLSGCIGRLVDPADKEVLYQLISSLDMRLALDHHFFCTGGFLSSTFRSIGKVLLWSLQEYQIHPEKATSLLKTIHQFDVWLRSQLQSVPINGLDNSFGLDLMIFAMTQIDGDATSLHHRLKILGLDKNHPCIPTALTTAKEIISPRYIWFDCRESTECFLMLHGFFHDPKRSGQYFMNGARYANAALHCMNFLFDTRQSDTRKWDGLGWMLERDTLYLAMGYATVFLGKATAMKPLFELLLGAGAMPKGGSGMYSFISDIETNARHRLNSRINMVFSIDKRTSSGDSLDVLTRNKSVEEWQEKSVQMVVRAMSEYISTTSRSFFPQN